MMKEILDILKWVPATALAALGTSIALAQWWTARARLRMDLFDRRWELYQAVIQNGILPAIIESQIETGHVVTFHRSIVKSKWLFDVEVTNYFKEIGEKLTELRMHQRRTQAVAADAARQTADDRVDDLSVWFSGQFDVLDEKCGPYLRLEEPMVTYFRSLLSKQARRSNN